MITPKNINNILNKITFTKEELKAHKVALNKIQDVEEAISTGYAMREFFEEAYDDAYTKIIKASDIIRFDWNDAVGEAEAILDDVEAELKELGVDPPSEVKQFRKQIDELWQDRKIADKKLDNIGKN